MTPDRAVSHERAAPRMSVIMAAYNGERYVKLAIESVLKQDFDGFEFVIVDDCSTDDTPAIIRSFADPRIVHLRNDSNLGQTPSLNVALSHARGALIARIDADDVYAAGKLRRQYEFMVAHPEVTVCGTWAVRIDSEGRNHGVDSPPVHRSDVMFRLLRGVPVCHVSVVMRKSAVAGCGGYPARYRFAADYALWSTLARNGAVITNIPERLTYFRELPATFGAAQKVGAAGDESAEIIQSNARDFAGVELSLEECRDIALLYFPAAGLTPGATCRAYLNLDRLARGVYGVPPMRVRVELIGVLFWSLLKRSAYIRSREPRRSLRGEVWSALVTHHRHPGVVAATMSAFVMSALGERNVARLKALVMGGLGRLSSFGGVD